MRYKHYAPKADLLIVEGSQQAVVDKINELIKDAIDRGEMPGVIAADETVSQYVGGIVKAMGSREDELSISRHLYGVLREFDEEKVSVIYSEAFETPDLGQAIMNRLIKAAGHQIIRV